MNQDKYSSLNRVGQRAPGNLGGVQRWWYSGAGLVQPFRFRHNVAAALTYQVLLSTDILC